MDIALLALKLLVLLPICSFAPGLLFVRRMKWSPLEKLCGAVGASLILTYLASFALFYLNAKTRMYWATTTTFTLMGCLSWRQALVLFRHRRSRAAILAFVAIFAWDFLHLAMIRHFGGGNWSGDWHEHYGRTRYFLHLLPDNFLYLDKYPLPARPPMMNLLAAYYCAQVGINFPAYSLVFVFLNAMAFLPCCLALRLMGKHGAYCIPILAMLFMLNPSVMQNATYTWTKALSAGFVIAGVCFYLRGLRHTDRWRILAAAISLVAGILVHYSATVFAIVIAIHYIVIAIMKRRAGSEVVLSGILAAGLLATWFVWSIDVFGFHTTFFSNSTSAAATGTSVVQNVEKLFFNCFTSLVPFHSASAFWLSPPQNWGELRDEYFMMSQTTLTLMIGLTAGIVVLLKVVKFFLCSDGKLTLERWFWIWFVTVSFLLACAVNPDWGGGAQVTMQALALLGLTFLAGRFGRLNRAVLYFVLAGVVVDYLLGVFLNFDRLSYIYPTTATPSGINVVPDQTLGWGRGEYSAKLVMHLTFWGDYLAPICGLLKLISILAAAWMVSRLAKVKRVAETRTLV